MLALFLHTVIFISGFLHSTLSFTVSAMKERLVLTVENLQLIVFTKIKQPLKFVHCFLLHGGFSFVLTAAVSTAMHVHPPMHVCTCARTHTHTHTCAHKRELRSAKRDKDHSPFER